MRENGSQFDQRSTGFGIWPGENSPALEGWVKRPARESPFRDERKRGGSFVPAGLMAHAVADPSPQGLGYFQQADRLPMQRMLRDALCLSGEHGQEFPQNNHSPNRRKKCNQGLGSSAANALDDSTDGQDNQAQCVTKNDRDSDITREPTYTDEDFEREQNELCPSRSCFWRQCHHARKPAPHPLHRITNCRCFANTPRSALDDSSCKACNSR